MDRRIVDRVLLIEDDTGAQLLFKNRLEDLGYEVVVAGTGARGLMEARATSFDLFLVDIGLGSGIDGYEVCRRLKGTPSVNSIPVVLISGQVKGQEELHKGYEAGCHAFLVKGDLMLLEDVVRAMLRTKALQDDLALQNRLLEEQNRRLQEERRRREDLELLLREGGNRAGVVREIAAGRPDGVLLVDAEGIVCYADQGARNVLGQDLEERHLGSLAPHTRLEAIVRDARTQPHEAYRFDLYDRAGSVARSLAAAVVPLVPRDDRAPYKVVLLQDAGKRRVAAELLRFEERGVPRSDLGPLLELAAAHFRPTAILGTSPALAAVRARAAALAGSREPVLLVGGSGTGKELVARVLHFSGTTTGPFVPLECRALAPERLEEELFGHAKEAGEDQRAERPGLVHQADAGTLFLDGVDALPAEVQLRIAALTEAGPSARAGSRGLERISVRLVATTTLADPSAREGALAPELARLFVANEIHLPPLCERREDIRVLAQEFLRRFSSSELGDETLWVMERHPWPGNVRELLNCVQSASSAAGDRAFIEPTDLPQPLFDLHKELAAADAIPAMPARAPRPDEAPPGARELADVVPEDELSLQAAERAMLERALRKANGNKVRAARLLGLGKSTLYRKLQAHRIR